MWIKIKSVSQKICDVLELILAVIVCIAIAITIIRFIPHAASFLHAGATVAAFMEFLEEVFAIVIGVEFLQMLCKPSSENVIEVLIFLVTRHMIIGDTSSLEDLLSIISIALLFLVRSYLRKSKAREKTDASNLPY